MLQNGKRNHFIWFYSVRVCIVFVPAILIGEVYKLCIKKILDMNHKDKENKLILLLFMFWCSLFLT